MPDASTQTDAWLHSELIPRRSSDLVSPAAHDRLTPPSQTRAMDQRVWSSCFQEIDKYYPEPSWSHQETRSQSNSAEAGLGGFAGSGELAVRPPSPTESLPATTTSFPPTPAFDHDAFPEFKPLDDGDLLSYVEDGEGDVTVAAAGAAVEAGQAATGAEQAAGLHGDGCDPALGPSTQRYEDGSADDLTQLLAMGGLVSSFRHSASDDWTDAATVQNSEEGHREVPLVNSATSSAANLDQYQHRSEHPRGRSPYSTYATIATLQEHRIQQQVPQEDSVDGNLQAEFQPSFPAQSETQFHSGFARHFAATLAQSRKPEPSRGTSPFPDFYSTSAESETAPPSHTPGATYSMPIKFPDGFHQQVLSEAVKSGANYTQQVAILKGVREIEKTTAIHDIAAGTGAVAAKASELESATAIMPPPPPAVSITPSRTPEPAGEGRKRKAGGAATSGSAKKKKSATAVQAFSDEEHLAKGWVKYESWELMAMRNPELNQLMRTVLELKRWWNGLTKKSMVEKILEWQGQMETLQKSGRRARAKPAMAQNQPAQASMPPPATPTLAGTQSLAHEPAAHPSTLSLTAAQTGHDAHRSVFQAPALVPYESHLTGEDRGIKRMDPESEHGGTNSEQSAAFESEQSDNSMTPAVRRSSRKAENGSLGRKRK